MTLGDDIFAGAVDRLFIWPAYHVGHIIHLPQVELQSDAAAMVSLETLHVDPPIFRIKNFVSSDEAMQIIQGRSFCNRYLCEIYSVLSPYMVLLID